MTETAAILKSATSQYLSYA